MINFELDSKIKNVIENIKKSNECLSCGFIGSGLTQNQRDVDILVIYNSNRSFQREVVDIKGLEFDISYISIFDIENEVEKKSTIWTNALAKYKALFCNSDLLEKKVNNLVKKSIYLLESNLYNSCEDNIKFIRFDLTKKFMYLKSVTSDEVLLKYLKNTYIKYLVECYYELNNLIIPKEKSQLKKIMDLDSNLYKLIGDYYSDESIEALDKVLDSVLKNFGGKLFEFSKGIYPINR